MCIASATDIASFTKEAMARYSQLSVAEKNYLTEQALSNQSFHQVPMSVKRIKKIASKIFGHIQKEVKYEIKYTIILTTLLAQENRRSRLPCICFWSYG